MGQNCTASVDFVGSRATLQSKLPTYDEAALHGTPRTEGMRLAPESSWTIATPTAYEGK